MFTPSNASSIISTFRILSSEILTYNGLTTLGFDTPTKRAAQVRCIVNAVGTEFNDNKDVVDRFATYEGAWRFVVSVPPAGATFRLRQAVNEDMAGRIIAVISCQGAFALADCGTRDYPPSDIVSGSVTTRACVTMVSRQNNTPRLKVLIIVSEATAAMPGTLGLPLTKDLPLERVGFATEAPGNRTHLRSGHHRLRLPGYLKSTPLYLTSSGGALPNRAQDKCAAGDLQEGMC